MCTTTKLRINIVLLIMYLIPSTWGHKLSWNEHIQRVLNKDTQANAFFHQNLRHCPINIKCACYKSMVRSIVEFVSPVWDPCTIANINKLEAIQRAAARFCFNNF